MPPSCKQDASFVAGINMVWFEAQKLTEDFLKKRGLIDHEGDKEDPLPVHIQDELLLAFKKLYKYDPITTWILPDGLIGKIHREF